MNYLKILFLIAIGGAIGSVARFIFSTSIHLLFDRFFPFGILLTNVIGSFLMGYLSIVLFEELPYAYELRSFTLIGILGGFTTFSTFSLDTINLLRTGHWIAAGLNVVLSVVICLFAAGFGIYLGRIIG
ncbi:MAG: camphor resistance protein CrcB [Gammaproteobacteria bacterium RIFCSPHIGHO2_12_FULL_35_23]|nr:MAG: camphor resistance protein CrcB [Gammaproteobacteria bacterium RIFCSPHIGHO2_12_FULL_35_23]